MEAVGQKDCSIYGEDTITDEEGKFRLRGLRVSSRRFSVIYFSDSGAVKWVLSVATGFYFPIVFVDSDSLEPL